MCIELSMATLASVTFFEYPWMYMVNHNYRRVCFDAVH